MRFVRLSALVLRNIRVFQRRFSSVASTELKKTKLNAFHIENDGKLVDFGGFSMPVQYKNLSIADSTLHTRRSCSLFDVSHMGQLKYYGKDRIRFLESILVSSVSPLKTNQLKYSLMLNKNGGIIDDLVFGNCNQSTNDEHHYMVINAGRITEDLQHINHQLSKFNGDCNYTFMDGQSLIALQGPKAVHVLQRLTSDFDFSSLKFFYLTDLKISGIPTQVSRSGYTGEDGFEISVNDEQVVELSEILLNESEVELAGLGARDALRLEAGLCLYGNELNEEITPNQADLMWTMSKKRKQEGGFLGFEKVRHQIVSGVKAKRIGIIGEKGLTPRSHQRILNESGTDVGEITSGTFSPCLQLPIAMAYVNSDYCEIGTSLEVVIRDNKKIQVKVCELPFVNKGYFK